MIDINNHIILKGKSLKQALAQINSIASDGGILFIVNEKNSLIGSLSEGDIRRHIIKSGSLENSIENISNNDPEFFYDGKFCLPDLDLVREKNVYLIPVVNSRKEIIKIINLRKCKSFLPIESVIMAGGKGERLLPLTQEIPKPLLLVGDKPIIEYSLQNMIDFGIETINVSLRYLGDQIENYVKDKYKDHLNLNFIWEKKPLGTAGAISLIEKFKYDSVLIQNSDLLSSINYEEFYRFFLDQKADIAVLSIPYKFQIPYAVMNVKNKRVKDFQEKPTKKFLTNGGVYLAKKEILNSIPHNEFFNMTDLMEYAIANDLNIVAYEHNGYWLDVGKHDDFKQAQKDCKAFN